MTAPLPSAVAAIREMWAGRSAAERSAFAESAAPVANTPDQEQITRVRVRAALSGTVAPAALIAGLDPDAGPRVLGVLAPEFDRSHGNEGWRWTLRSGPRRDTLRGLAGSREALLAALADAEAVPTDAAGRYLRELAAGPGPAGPDLGGPRVVLQALAWAEPLGGFAGDLAEARRRVRVEAVADSYGALLGNGFFGRDDELIRLRDFATASIVPADQPVPLLPLVGLGGTGKSTALAAFIAPYLRELRRPDTTGPVVIVIDFDRVPFRADAELDLSYEVSRQLGNAHPVAAADFSALRYQVREERAGTAAARYSGSLAAGEGSGDALAFARDASMLVRMHGLDGRAVLLILDTFEQWQREPGFSAGPGEGAEGRVLRWITRLRDTMGLRGLRVILSGRADVTIDPTESVGVEDAVRLADLAPAAAAELLAAHGVPPDQSAALAGLAGGDPRTLRVAARFFNHLTAGEREAFLAGGLDVPEGGRRGEILYGRFLDHIGDPGVRRLARAGLALRRVTPGLIRDVLGPHCDLGPLTDASAAELLERLAEEDWLVGRDGDGLRHLPEVRRVLLHLVAGDPGYAESLAAIHRAAAAWYHAVAGEEAAVEELYHDLMQSAGPGSDFAGPGSEFVGSGSEFVGSGSEFVGPGSEFAGRGSDFVGSGSEFVGSGSRLAAPVAHLVAPGSRLAGLGESVADLPAVIAAEVRVLRGELPPLREALLVRDPLWARWVARRGAVLVNGGMPEQALEMLDVREVGEEPPWLAQAYGDLGRWEEYRHGTGPGPRRYQVVAAIVSGTDIPGFVAHTLIHSYYRMLLRRPADLAGWRLAEPLLAEFAALLPTTNRTSSDLFPVDELRRTLAWVAAGCPGEAVVLRGSGRWGAEPFTGTLVRRSPEILWDLRGDNPELRAAVRTALADTGDPDVPDAEGLARLDRGGELGRFLDESVRRWPQAALLGRVRNAFHRWDRANNAVIETIIRDIQANQRGE